MFGKMTLISNPESYTDLLIRYQPKPIATDADYEAAIDLAREIEHREHPTQAEETLLELLVTLIEKYESVHEPMPMTSNRSMLLHLMDAQDLAAADLVDVLGSAAIVERVLSGQQPIDAAQVQLLADRLNVPSQVFS
jgi:HTH-type transcriptional regulator / antitoxin HigA